MTTERLREIEEMLTSLPARWEFHKGDVIIDDEEDGTSWSPDGHINDSNYSHETATFIGNSKSIVSELVAEIRRLRRKYSV